MYFLNFFKHKKKGNLNGVVLHNEKKKKEKRNVRVQRQII